MPISIFISRKAARKKILGKGTESSGEGVSPDLVRITTVRSDSRTKDRAEKPPKIAGVGVVSVSSISGDRDPTYSDFPIAEAKVSFR